MCFKMLEQRCIDDVVFHQSDKDVFRIISAEKERLTLDTLDAESFRARKYLAELYERISHGGEKQSPDHSNGFPQNIPALITGTTRELGVGRDAIANLFRLKADSHNFALGAKQVAGVDDLLKAISIVSSREFSDIAGYPALDMIECLEAIIVGINSVPNYTKSKSAKKTLGRVVYPLLFRQQVLCGRYERAISSCKIWATYAPQQAHASQLGLFLDRQVQSVAFLDDGGYKVFFVDGSDTTIQSRKNVRKEYPVERIIFAIFAHDEFCGTKITYDFVRDYIDLKGVQGIHVSKLSDVKIKIGIHQKNSETITKYLTRDPSKAVSAPTHEEYFRLPFEANEKDFGVFPPGRSLYPVPYSEWETRAKNIIAHSSDLDKLLHLPPMMVTLGITDLCHLKCDFCFVSSDFSKKFGKTFNKKHRFMMAKEELFRLIEDLSEMGVKAIRYVGEGESPLHPNFIDSVVLARARGMRVSLINSGGKIEKFYAVFARYLDYVRVSWNAGTPRTYRKIHKSSIDQFGRVLKGYFGMSTEREKLPKSGPIICCSYVATQENFEEFPRLSKVAELAGADFVILKRDSEWQQTPEEEALYNQIVDKCKYTIKKEKRFVVSDYPSYDETKIQKIPNYEVEFGLGCFVHNAGLRANVSYNVAYSSMKFNGPGTILGDLSDGSFSTHWSGEKRHEGAQTKIVQDKSLPCPRCFWRDTKIWMNCFIVRALSEQEL